MRTSNELQIGKAGEYLTCADLILKGFVAFPSEQGLPFDVVMDNGKRLLRIQVKTTEKPRTVPQRVSESSAYIFNIKRAGKDGKSRYDENDIDLFALVCLDTMKVGYLVAKDMPETINIRVDSLRGTHRDEKGIRDYAIVKEMNKTIKSQSEIARRTGMHVSTVNRMLMDGFEPYKTNARYFSDFERDHDWFVNLQAGGFDVLHLTDARSPTSSAQYHQTRTTKRNLRTRRRC